MKKFNFFAMLVAGLLLIFTSCSKDEVTRDTTDSEMAVLSFGAVLNDLVQNRMSIKQQMMVPPECSDAPPSYVEVVLSGTTQVGSIEDPIIVNINPTPGDFDDDGVDEYFTVESSDLELEAGTYTLEFFAVYDADDNLIWLAPYEGGGLDAWVNNLPFEFDLGAGTKKYLDVDVLCYDDRLVNEYGYLFFDLDNNEAIEFCMFGNFCDETGRHFVAEYEVDVWYGTNDSGEVLYTNVGNTPQTNELGEIYSNPVCFALPDREGEDNYYFEISMDGQVIRSGTITDGDVRDLFDGDDSVDYYHFRAGDCSNDDTPDLFNEDTSEPGEPSGEVVCTTVDFEDLESHSDFTAAYYADRGVTILAGPGFSENAMIVRGGTCSENVLHSRDYPYASVLFNFSTDVHSISVEAGDYGEDEDTIIVTAYSGLDGTGEVIATQTRVLPENESGCLEFDLEGEGIRSVIVDAESSIEGHENTLFTDNLRFCTRQ